MAIKTFNYLGFTIDIDQDEWVENPRTYDPLGVMICFHRTYDLGDKHDYNKDDYGSFEELKKAICNKENIAVILPLYLYDHSGITMSTGSFNCRWDSGQVGWIYLTKEDVRKTYGVKRITSATLDRATKALEAEVKIYDSYISGEVYQFTITDSTGETVDNYGGCVSIATAESDAIDIISSYKEVKLKSLN